MRAALLAILALGVGGCGYALAARPPLPGGAREVAVPLLRNDTAEPELGQILTEALGRRAAREDRLGDGGGHLVLLGRVEAVRAAGAAYPAGVAGPGAWRVSLRLHLRLVPSEGGPAIRDFKVSGDEPYLAGVGPEQTEANRRRAVARLAERLADEAWDRITEE